MTPAGSEGRRCPQGQPRLDKWLASWRSVGSRKRAASLVASGKVEIDGEPIAPDGGGLPVAGGAQVVVHWNRPGTNRPTTVARAAMTSAGLSILYEDKRVVVIDKPPGLLTDTATRKQARERDSVRARVKAWLQPQGQFPVVVHRIDRDTSGVVVVARDAEAGERLRAAFAAHKPERTYLTWVHGVPEGTEGVWEDEVWWDPKVNEQKLARPGSTHASKARSWWRVDQSFPGTPAARLAIRLDTGRRNQIRLQASLRGHPLIGEVQYVPEEWTPRGPRFPRQALHAHRVVFPHPDDGRPITVEAPLPDDLVALEAKLTSRR